MLPRRALPIGRITGLGATQHFYHGLLGDAGRPKNACQPAPRVRVERQKAGQVQLDLGVVDHPYGYTELLRRRTEEVDVLVGP